jgi:hypothetical protein
MPASDRLRRPQRTAILLTVFVGVIATVVAYLGTRESTRAPAPARETVDGTTLPVQTIVLPPDDVDLPHGPHQATFVTSCTICHSTRMVMTQPPFPRKQWEEVVHKMVKTYGAPVTPGEQEQILEYLTAVRGE